MATKKAIALFFTTQNKTFEIDCTDSFDRQFSAQITQYPTEKGNPVADHRDRNPKTLTLTGQMSDVHYERFPYDPTTPAPYDIEATGVHTEFEAALLAADENNELITVNAGRRGTFTDMLIQNLDLPATPGTGAAVFFSLSLIKLSVVETKVRDLHAEKQEREWLDLKRDQANQELFDQAGGYEMPDPITGAKVVKSPELLQRWQPTQNRGLSSPSAAGSVLSDQVLSIGAPGKFR